MYLTFDEYEEYSGFEGEINDETVFKQYEFKARKLIDSVTANRVSKMQEIPEAVKRCMYELIKLECIYDSNVGSIMTGTSNGGSGGKIISSFTNDGYTESYATGASNPGEYLWQFRRTVDRAQITIINDYLCYEYDDNHIPLLYRGVYR